MASAQESVEFDKTLHDLNVALDVLTDTLSGVTGCEYPRLLAREIQSLIVACIVHERVRRSSGGEPVRQEMPVPPSENPSRASETLQLMVRTLEAREAEIAHLRDVLHHGIDAIEAHTLTDADGTAVMYGDYQCISASAVEQWLRRAETALNNAGRATA